MPPTLSAFLFPYGVLSFPFGPISRSARGDIVKGKALTKVCAMSLSLKHPNKSLSLIKVACLQCFVIIMEKLTNIGNLTIG